MDVYDSGQEKADLKRDNSRAIISVRNVHKTYLLGLEGVTALRGTTRISLI